MIIIFEAAGKCNVMRYFIPENEDCTELFSQLSYGRPCRSDKQIHFSLSYFSVLNFQVFVFKFFDFQVFEF